MCAWRAENFRELYNFFARVGRKICVIPTLHAFFFGYECNSDSTNSISDVVKYAQRTLAECTQILCARRAGLPEILQFFRAILAQIIMVCVISTPDARLFGCQRKHDFVKTFQDIRRVAAHAGRVHAIFCARGAPKIFKNFCNFSRDFGATFACSRRSTRAFSKRSLFLNW